MTEKILKIENDEEVRYNNEKWIGCTITTEKQTIRVYIDNYHLCCEEYDVILLSPPNIDLDKDLKDKDLELISIGWAKNDDIDPQFHEQFANKIHGGMGDTPFHMLGLVGDTTAGHKMGNIQYATLDLHTNKGLLQIVAYNDHNGYYEHNLYVEWDGYTDTQLL